jgi:DNA-binding XRE family transcriptional regulator
VASFRRKRGDYWETPSEDRPLALTGLAERWAEAWEGRARFTLAEELGPGEALTLPLLSLVRSVLVLLREKLADPASGVSWAEPSLVVYWDPGPDWARELILEEGLTPERLARATGKEEHFSFVLLTLTRRVGVRATGKLSVPPGETEEEAELEVLVPPRVQRELAALLPEQRTARAAELAAPLLLGGLQYRFDSTLPPNVKLGPEVARTLSIPAEPGLAFEGDAAGRFVSGSLVVAVHPLEVGPERNRYPVAVALMLDPESAYIEGEADEAGLSEIRGITLDPPDPSTWTEAERAALFDGLLAWLDETLERYPGRVVLGNIRREDVSQAAPPEALAALRASSEPARALTLHEAPTRIDKNALALLNASSGLTLPRSLAKVPRWDELVREEAARIYTEQGEEAFKPKPGVRGKLLEKRTARGGETVFSLTPEAEDALLQSEGHKGFVRKVAEPDGGEREYFMKRFRAGGGFLGVGLSWYGAAAPLGEDETRRDLERERERASLGELFEADRAQEERRLRRLGSISDAREVAKLILHRFGARGENPLRVPVQDLRVLLECEKDPNGLARVRGALQALQELRFVLNTSGVGGGLSLRSSGSFLNDVTEIRRGGGGHGEGEFSVTISERFVGVLHAFNTAHYRIRDAQKVLTYDWGKKLEDAEREELRGGYLRGFSSLTPYYDKAAGFTESQSRLRTWIEAELTRRKDPTAVGRESARAKKDAPDRDAPRVYGADFCPLLPQGQRFHGALGHFDRRNHGNPEKGRTLAGTRTLPSTSGKSGGRREGLLAVMSYTLPPGAASRARRKVYADALQDIRRVVVETFGGVVAGRTTEGRWLALADVEKLSEQELGRGVSWCLFLPEDWQAKRRAGFEKYQAERHERGETPYRVTVSTGPEAEAVAGADAAWKRLPEVRQERKLSQAQVGRVFGVSQQVVAYWEAGPEPNEDGRVKGKAVPAYLEPLLRHWIETSNAPTEAELAEARKPSSQPPTQ